MKKIYLFFLLFSTISFSQIINPQHCGYDFISYFVVKVYENGKKQHIKNLRLTIIDSTGNEVINTNNKYSWTNKNLPLVFKENYILNLDEKNKVDYKERWYFPFATDSYLLTIVNTFKAEDFSLKIEDVDQLDNFGFFKTQIIPLYSFNMYVLCTTQSKNAVQQFGPKINKPIEVFLEKQP